MVKHSLWLHAMFASAIQPIAHAFTIVTCFHDSIKHEQTRIPGRFNLLSLLWLRSIWLNPTIRDNRLDSIGLWICPCLMVECLHVMSLLPLESAILADGPLIENTLSIHMFVFVLILVKSQYDSQLIQILSCLSITPLHALMIISWLRSIHLNI